MINMNKILDKFGVYDLVAVLLSGISISTFSVLVLQLVYRISFDTEILVSGTLSFLVISYFLGLIFQELGSLIQKKITHKNNGLLMVALNTSDNSHIYLTDEEKNKIYAYIKEKLNLKDDNDNIAYNYCKFYVLGNCDTSKIDKVQSLSAMSRSLSLYFFLLALFVLYTLSWQLDMLRLILVFVSAAFSILLYQRCIRFAKLRYVYIFRAFYYKKLANKK